MKLIDLLNEGIYDPGIFKVVFMAGGPGSGKSYMVSQIFGVPDNISIMTGSSFGLKSINSDREFEAFLKKAGMSTDVSNLPDDKKDDIIGLGSNSLRSKAKVSTQFRKRGYVSGKLGLIIDGTGRNYKNIKRQKLGLEHVGYDAYLIFINTSLETALKRNKERTRVLPDEMVTKMWHSVQDNLGKFQNLFGSSSILIIDNNGKTDNAVVSKAYNIVSKWIKAPIKNKIAKQWIDSEKQRRGITK